MGKARIVALKQLGIIRHRDGFEDMFNLVPDGDICLEIMYANRPRSIRQLRLYWGLMSIITENTDKGWTIKDTSDQMKVAAGHYYEVINMDGSIERRAKSIAIPAMEQAPFNKLMNQFITIICTRLIPGIEEGDIRRRLLEIVGG